MNQYTVEVFNNRLTPNEREYHVVGRFATEEQAIACARGVIDTSLGKLRELGFQYAGLLTQWSAFGQGVRIDRVTPVRFDPYEYARIRAYSE